MSEFKVANGSVLVSDATVEPPFAVTLRAVELGVRSFSTAPNSTATVVLSLTTDANESLRETGELTFSPLAARGTVGVAGVPLRRYAAYYRDAVAFEIRDGVLGFSTGYTWSASSDGWTLSDLAATLRSLRLRRSGERGDFLAVPETALKGSALDLAARTLALGELSLTDARLAVTRGADGVWNLASLLPPSPAAPSGPAGGGPAAAPPPEAASPAWTVALKRLVLQRAVVEVDDALPARPVHIVLASLAVTARDLSTVPGAQGRLELRSGVNGSGTMSLAGGPAPSAGFTGLASVDRLATVDAHAAEDLVKKDSLAFTGVSFASESFRL